MTRTMRTGHAPPGLMSIAAAGTLTAAAIANAQISPHDQAMEAVASSCRHFDDCS